MKKENAVTAVSPFIDLLGKTARDRVTKLEGVVCTISFDLFGCVQAVLRPPMNKDGKLDDAHWFDVHRLELVNDERVMAVPRFDITPTFGATPQTHQHGPSEKPARKL